MDIKWILKKNFKIKIDKINLEEIENVGIEENRNKVNEK